MVHPLMRQSPSGDEKGPNADDVAAGIVEMLPRLHVLVVGPGLGRDPLMQETVSRVIRAARERKMAIVLDADALQVVQKDPDSVKGYKEAVLTPNVVEFGRIWDALGLEDSGKNKNETDRVEILARALGGVTIVQKGPKDFVSNGETTLVSHLEGGKKRSGGQGDTLTGSIATFLAWRKAYLDKLWHVGGQTLDEYELIRLAAFGGSAITRVSPRERLPILFYRQPRQQRALSQLKDAFLSNIEDFFRQELSKDLHDGIGVFSTRVPQKRSKPSSKRSNR